MKQFYSNLIFTTLIASSAAVAVEAAPAARFDLSRHTYKTQNVASPFESDRMKKIVEANDMLDGKSKARKAEMVTQPKVQSIGPASRITDLDTPWGETWFYSSNFRYSYIKVSEDYNRPILEEYEFIIYDSQMNKIGTVKDKMTYITYDELRDPDSVINKDDLELYGPYHREVAVAACELTPIVTRHFFNNDDKYEIMVGLSVQTTYYVNNNYNRIYQIGGETYETTDHWGATQTYDKMITSFSSQVGDVFASTDADGEEKVYMTFMEDLVPDDDFELPDFGDDDDSTLPDDPSDIVIPGYWEHYCANGIKMVTCRGVKQGETEIQPVLGIDMYHSRQAGDMQNSPFMFTLEHNGKAHLVASYYEDTFWNPYHSPLAEMTMRENNKLVIDVYRENEDGTKFELLQTTKIPTYLTPDYGSEKYLASWFSVGDFRYRQDVFFGNDGKVSSYTVTKQDYVAGNDDATVRSYYSYDADGNLLNTIFERSQSFIPMSDIPGYEPQTMFINTNSMGDYIFHFIDLKSVKEVLTLNYQFEIDEDSDPERMTSNLDRVAVGDTYMYADELRVPSQDDEGNDNGRIIWFNRDGSFDRIDEVNMGKNVYYALSYIDSKTLNPNFFYPDKHNEYMMLVKRAYAGESPAEELLIAQARNVDSPDGITLLSDGPDERGVLGGISILNNQEQSLLFVTKIDGNSMQYWDVYALPFALAGIDEVTTGDSQNGISFDGSTIVAEGRIVLYNLHGMKVAEGDDTLSTDGVGAGLYIATAGGEARKIAIK